MTELSLILDTYMIIIAFLFLSQFMFVIGVSIIYIVSKEWKKLKKLITVFAFSFVITYGLFVFYPKYNASYADLLYYFFHLNVIMLLGVQHLYSLTMDVKYIKYINVIYYISVSWGIVYSALPGLFICSYQVIIFLIIAYNQFIFNRKKVDSI